MLKSSGAGAKSDSEAGRLVSTHTAILTSVLLDPL